MLTKTTTPPYRSLTICCLIVSLFITNARLAAQPAPAASINPQSSDVHHLLTQYYADRGSLSRFYTVLGSPERRERFQRLHTDYLNQVEQLNFARMNTDSRVDYLLFKRDLQESLYKLAAEATERQQIKDWFPFADTIYAAEKLRRRGHVPQARQLAQNLTTISQQLVQVRQEVDKIQKQDPALLRQAEQTAQGLKTALSSIYTFYNRYDPDFTFWVPQPYQKTDSLLTAYAAFFQKKARQAAPVKEDGSGIVGVAVGRTELIRQLQMEMIPYSPEELIAMANKEFAWCDKELLKASREMGFGDDWKAAQEKVKNSYVPVGKQPELILRLYNESVAFLKAKNLITIPPIAEETWRMSMMSPERQLVNPFFLGGESIIISYPTDGMKHPDKVMSMRGNNPHFSRATVHHELME